MRLPVYREIVGADVMAVGQGRGGAEDVLGPRIHISDVKCVIRAGGRRVLIGCLRLVRVGGLGLGLGLGLDFRVRVVWVRVRI